MADDQRAAKRTGCRRPDRRWRGARWWVSIAVTLLVPTGAAADTTRQPPQGRSADPAGATAAPVPAPAAGFTLPVAGNPLVLTPFDPPARPWEAGHRGVDLAAPHASVIVAAADGVVAFTGMVAGRPVVSVKHSAQLRTTYEPVVGSVGMGQRVRSGEPIGVLQDGHPSCAPAICLHWGARIGADTYLDPLQLLWPRRVRLKPWESG